MNLPDRIRELFWGTMLEGPRFFEDRLEMWIDTKVDNMSEIRM